MSWEYLDQENFELRYKIVMGYLEGREFFVGNLVDLNCGATSNLYYEIKDITGCYYYGNDINMKDEYIIDKTFTDVIRKQIPDTEVINDLPNYMDHIDCLVLMGDGAGHLTGEQQESATSMQSFFEIIKKYQPQTVIYETVKRFEEEYGLFSQVKEFAILQGYEIGGYMELNIKPDIGFVSNRLFGFYERAK